MAGGGDRFFIIGAMRSATTYLATILDEHPEVCMAKPLVAPERKFFLKDDEYARGPGYYESEYFGNCGKAVVFGEKTVHYCERDDAAARIKAFYPSSKIIMILRNPVFRALSNYFFSRQNGLETRGIEDVFLNDVPPPEYDRRMLVSPFDYLARGVYLEHIKRYERRFPSSSIRILVMEKFVGIRDEIANLYDFLGVAGDYLPRSVAFRIHSTGTDMAGINAKVLSRLQDYYSGKNCLLAGHLDVDLDIWGKEAAGAEQLT